MRVEDIDVWYDFQLDSKGKDPDSASKTMKEYQRLLWSKPLPSGDVMQLEAGSGFYLRWGGMNFGSDSITATFRWNKPLMAKVREFKPGFDEYIQDVLSKLYTIGGEMLMPSFRGCINQARGCNPRIKDRWDLTLECIRRYYAGEESPLSAALDLNKEYLSKFVDFKGFVDFYFLQDIVSEDYRQVILKLDTPLFEPQPLPKTVEDYLHYVEQEVEFVTKRNQRIAAYISKRGTCECAPSLD